MGSRTCRRGVSVTVLVALAWLPVTWSHAGEARDPGRSLADVDRLLENKDPRIRSKAVETLRLEFGPQAVPSLIRTLNDSDAAVRRDAIRALASIQPPAPETILALTKLTHDPDRGVRRTAVAALGDLRAVPALTQALKDPDKDIRRNAERALRRIATSAGGPHDREAASAAIAALTEALRDADKDLRYVAAGSLGVIGPAARDAIPTLAATMKDPDPSVRRVATQALGRIGGDAVVPALALALKDPQVADTAVSALAGLGPVARDAAPALIDYVKTGDDRVRPAALMALAKIGPVVVEVVPTLTLALNDTDAGVREAAVKALGLIGPPARSALPALREIRARDTVIQPAHVDAAISRIERE